MDIIEISLDRVTDAILSEARSRQVKVMVYHQQNDPDAFRQIIDWGVEMVNLNHADSFLKVLSENSNG